MDGVDRACRRPGRSAHEVRDYRASPEWAQNRKAVLRGGFSILGVDKRNREAIFTAHLDLIGAPARLEGSANRHGCRFRSGGGPKGAHTKCATAGKGLSGPNHKSLLGVEG